MEPYPDAHARQVLKKLENRKSKASAPASAPASASGPKRSAQSQLSTAGSSQSKPYAESQPSDPAGPIPSAPRSFIGGADLDLRRFQLDERIKGHLEASSVIIHSNNLFVLQRFFEVYAADFPSESSYDYHTFLMEIYNSYHTAMDTYCQDNKSLSARIREIGSANEVDVRSLDVSSSLIMQVNVCCPYSIFFLMHIYI